MALPPSASGRQLKHRRSIDVEVFVRDDGLWEVDAHLRDVKPRDIPMSDGPRRAGEPIHDMLLRLIVDRSMTIVDAGAETLRMPYPGYCSRHGSDSEQGDAYRRLVGLNLLRRFRHEVRQRLGGVLGCTHLSELTWVLPTAVVQAFSGEVIDTRGQTEDGAQPFQLDRCHALRIDGPAVREFYPRWYRHAPVRSPADSSSHSPTPATPESIALGESST
jgi:Protein of unknown function (DUF2889)